MSAALMATILLGCKDANQKTEDHDIVENTEVIMPGHDQEITAESSSLDNSWRDEIVLNDGKKWVANAETNEGVDKMLQLIETEHPKTVEQYHTLASKLNDEKNYVVKKCTMEGPSHDNLHIFLHPLIEKIEALQSVSTVDEGADMTMRIKENLEAYKNYFE